MSRALCALLLVASLAVPSAAAAGTAPEIVAVYPNPVAENDDGEFVVIRVPDGTDLSRYALDDGEDRVGLPAAGGGTVFVSTHPNLTARLVGREAAPVSDDLQLANDGERLRLVRGDETVDAVTYDWAPEGRSTDRRLGIGRGARSARRTGRS